MVYPEIKITEKRKSFNLKVKISKKDVKGVVFTSEDVTELKRTILEELNSEVDELIHSMVENDELNNSEYTELCRALDKVSVHVEGNQETEDEEQEVEEELELDESSEG
jgi:hypothetical protein